MEKKAINPSGADMLLEEIQAINDFTDIRKVQDLRERVLWLNTNDKRNNVVFEAARSKSLI